MASAGSQLTAARARGRARRVRRSLLVAVVILLVAVAAAALPVWLALRGHHGGHRALAPVLHPQVAWASPGARPLTDTAAAALVTPRPELRPVNATRNVYVPTDVQLQEFYAARGVEGHTRIQYSRLFGYVTGRPGLAHPTTDDLVQWAAHKWGIPEDVMRAQAQLESDSRMNSRGDTRPVSPAEYAQYPPRARVPGGRYVFQSMGIAQIKWVPGGRVGAGTEPLRWQSTAFALDVLGANVRYYYDGECGWCGPGYSAGQQWASVGAWFSPSPWDNAGAKRYVRVVQKVLRERLWE